MLFLYLFFGGILLLVNLVYLVVSISIWREYEDRQTTRFVQIAFIAIPLVFIWPITLVGGICYGIYYLTKVGMEVFSDGVR